MRDPNRIDEFCNELAKLWHKVPDWRFGQFLSNTMGGVCEKTHRSDIFFIEDDEMLEALISLFEKEDDHEDSSS